MIAAGLVQLGLHALHVGIARAEIRLVPLQVRFVNRVLNLGQDLAFLYFLVELGNRQRLAVLSTDVSFAVLKLKFASIGPETKEPTEICSTGLIVPVALTTEMMSPCATSAVRHFGMLRCSQ